MRDIDGNFCDGNGKLLPETGEDTFCNKLIDRTDQHVAAPPACTHSNTVSVSDTRRCIDCGQSMSGREQRAPQPTMSRWGRFTTALGNSLGESLFGGKR